MKRAVKTTSLGGRARLSATPSSHDLFLGSMEPSGRELLDYDLLRGLRPMDCKT